MFYALASALCLAVLFLALAGAFVVCAVILQFTKGWLQLLPPRSCANVLFLLRVLPFLVSGVATLGFALPAFLRFEPRSSHEIMGPRLLILAALATVIIAGVLFRVFWTLRATHRAQQRWLAHSEQFSIPNVAVPIYRTAMPGPLFAVTGVLRPRIFVVQVVVEKLSANELSAAIAHELAHVSTLDNLKQLILKATTPPQWLKLFITSNALWLNATEMAADEGALASGVSALDLSAALVKVGGLSRPAAVDNLVAACHLLPGDRSSLGQSCLEMRVQHLRELLEREDVKPGANRIKRRRLWPMLSFLLLFACYALCVNSMLPRMHEMLELLVR